MPKIYEGGCAVMLCLPNPSPHDASDVGKENKRKLNAIRRSLEEVPAGNWSERKGTSDWHITLAFVGRDMSNDFAKRVIDAAWKSFSGRGPIEVDFRGEFQAWGSGKGINLVMPAQIGSALEQARNYVVQALANEGVRLPSTRFNPHVTLGTVPKSAPNPSAKAVEPFTISCREVEVKYGRQRMRIELD